MSCNIFPTRSSKVFITDNDYYEIKRQYSPDKTKLLLTYGIDQGATGRGEVGTAMLNIGDSSKDIKPFTIAWYEYNDHEWLNNETAIFYLDYLKRMRQTKFQKQYFDTLINGIKIKYDYKDLVDKRYRADTLLNQLSPNNKYRLTVYHYLKDSSNNNFLNISVTKASDTIPKYGNFFIGEIKDDYIYYCRWSETNKLLLYTTSSCQNIIENYLVENRLDVPFEIRVKDDVQSPFQWTKKNGY
jgi:hypothetical protein